jgi:type III secretion protein T
MDGAYIRMITSVKGLTPQNLFYFFLLGFFRFGPIVSLAPFLGGKIAPNTARVTLALTFSALFLPYALLSSTSYTMTSMGFYTLAAKELLIGFMIGYLFTIPFNVVQSTGIIIDYMRGSSMLMAQDPTLQVQSSPIGIFFNFYLIVIFFKIGGLEQFFEINALFYEALPVNADINTDILKLTQPFFKSLVELLGMIFKLSLQLAAPAIVGILMAEVFLGIANRLAPQVQIAFLGMPLKSLLGLTLLWTGWTIINQKMEQITVHFFQWIKHGIHLLAG